MKKLKIREGLGNVNLLIVNMNSFLNYKNKITGWKMKIRECFGEKEINYLCEW